MPNNTKTKFKAMQSKNRYIEYSSAWKIINYFAENSAKYEGNNDYLYERNKCKELLLYVLLITLRRISEITGLRKKSEKRKDRCRGLRKEDIDFENNIITFYILKKNIIKECGKDGKKKRQESIIKELEQKEEFTYEMDVPEELIEVLKDWCDYLNIKDKQVLFKIHPVYMSAEVKRVAKELDIYLKGKHKKMNKLTGVMEKVKVLPTVHTFRHAGSVHFLDINGNTTTALLSLQEILQHSSIQVTEGYAQVKDDTKRELLRRAMVQEEE